MTDHLNSKPLRSAAAAEQLAAASTALLNTWCAAADLVVPVRLMEGDSLVLDTLPTAASLALAMARTFAGCQHTDARQATLDPVLRTAFRFARAVSVPGHKTVLMTTPSKQVLAQKDVFELLLLGYGAHTCSFTLEYTHVYTNVYCTTC